MCRSKITEQQGQVWRRLMERSIAHLSKIFKLRSRFECLTLEIESANKAFI
ncbi:MAG: hypothetical protein LH679_17645 [Cyanobacteria bacterium CAN_BIN43]|nr:hypothetical protein [Cyanobacteria bacterium CAN_BIN43]